MSTAVSVQRIFLSGPMSGLPDFNYPAFHAEAARLRAQGFDVENPAENAPPPCGSWSGYMRLAIAQLVRSDVVWLLPGWQASQGACIEHALALRLGLAVVYNGGPESQPVL